MEYPKGKLIPLVLLRLAIGWHFLYEGLVKALNPAWSSKAYLLDSGGFMKWFFHWIARHPDLLAFTDFINAWGLSLIGLLLITGFLTDIFHCWHGFTGLVLPVHPRSAGDQVSYAVGWQAILCKQSWFKDSLPMYVIFRVSTSFIMGIKRLLKPKNKDII